jgi:hypothetical protein
MSSSLSSYIDLFFENAKKPNNAIVFTTFTLDEVVLSCMLRQHRVNSQQRIVVFHEIMKHRNPGALLHEYPNSLVVSIDLKKTSAKMCPVFHSKLWLCVSRSMQCSVIAISSINLSRYHLSLSAPTIESFIVWINQNMPIGNLQLFRRDFIHKITNHIVFPMTPSTWIIDSSAGNCHRIRETMKPVLSVIESHCVELPNDRVIGVASPFFCGTAVCRMAELSPPIPRYLPAWRGARKPALRLHAKFIELNKHLIVGSPNNTVQAIIGNGAKAVNHETIVKIRKTIKLSRLLRGFIQTNGLDYGDNAPPGDDDGDDAIGVDLDNWLEQKRRARAAPYIFRLKLFKEHARIIHKGGRRCSSIRLVGTGNDEECAPEVILPISQLGKLNKNTEQDLAMVVASPPVVATGLLYGKPVWIRELDLGDLWAWFVHSWLQLRYKYSPGGPPHSKDSPNKSRFDRFIDVREARNQSAIDKGLSFEGVRKWDIWFRRHQVLSQQSIPEWCFLLAKHIKRGPE